MARTAATTEIVVSQRFHDLMRATPFADGLDALPIDDEPAASLYRAVFAAEADERGDRTVTLTAAQLDELYAVALVLASPTDRAAEAGEGADREAVSAVMRQVENVDTAPTRRVSWPAIVAIVAPFAALAATLVLVLGGAGSGGGDREGEHHTVVYEVLGNDTTVDIVYGMVGRQTPLPSATAVTLPWRKEVPVTAEAGEKTTITVFIADPNGTVRCVLFVDGSVADTDGASGRGGIAHCAGSIVRRR